MKRTGVNEKQFGKWWMRTAYFLLLTQLFFSYLPLAKANQEVEILSDQQDPELGFSTINSKRDFHGVKKTNGGSLRSFLKQSMPRFSRRTTDHMLRFTRSNNGGSDDHMLRFTRSNDGNEDHMLRFTRSNDVGGENNDHMLRFTRNSDDDYMLRFTRESDDSDHHMLRFTRGSDDSDHHMLRFTRGSDDSDHHMLRFTRGNDDSDHHMLRFTRGSDDSDHHMLRFTRGSDEAYQHMLRYSRNPRNEYLLRESNDDNIYKDTSMLRFARSYPYDSDKNNEFGKNIPLDVHMLRFSKKNDDNHMLRYSREPKEVRSYLQPSPHDKPSSPTVAENIFPRYTRKIKDSMMPRLVRQDDHLLRFA